jgi:hypothetical protein
MRPPLQAQLDRRLERGQVLPTESRLVERQDRQPEQMPEQQPEQQLEQRQATWREGQPELVLQAQAVQLPAPHMVLRQMQRVVAQQMPPTVRRRMQRVVARQIQQVARLHLPRKAQRQQVRMAQRQQMQQMVQLLMQEMDLQAHKVALGQAVNRRLVRLLLLAPQIQRLAYQLQLLLE